MATAGAPGSAGSRLAALHSQAGDNEAIIKANWRVSSQVPWFDRHNQ